MKKLDDSFLLELSELGEEARRRDLDADSCRKLRCHVAEIMAVRGERAPLVLWRPALRWAAVVLLMLSGVGGLVLFRQGSGDRVQVAPGVGATVELDAAITDLRARIEGEMSGFRRDYVEQVRSVGLERRSRTLRARIQLCALELESELNLAGGGEGGGAIREDGSDTGGSGGLNDKGGDHETWNSSNSDQADDICRMLAGMDGSGDGWARESAPSA